MHIPNPRSFHAIIPRKIRPGSKVIHVCGIIGQKEGEPGNEKDNYYTVYVTVHAKSKHKYFKITIFKGNSTICTSTRATILSV